MAVALRRLAVPIACALTVATGSSATKKGGGVDRVEVTIPRSFGASAVFAPPDAALLDDLQHAAFRFFAEQSDPVTGLVRDRARADGSPSDVIGIDLGIELLQIENARTAMVQSVFMRAPEVRRALARAGFLPTSRDLPPEDRVRVHDFAVRIWNAVQSAPVTSKTAGLQLSAVAAAAGRLLEIVRFLDRAQRYHGAWSHFLDGNTGNTGKTIPFFGKYDDGGDIVETAFMMQGLLAARQYFNQDDSREREIRGTITRFWREVEWDWYRRTPDSPVLYWHWSPDHGFYIHHPLIGWNETMIVYLLAIASPTHPVPASMYYSGWAGDSDLHRVYRRGWSRTTTGDQYVNGGTYYGIKLAVGEGDGSDLFFTHFSFMGFDPRGRRDRFTNYFTNNRAIALINHAYCAANPRGFEGYAADSWGLSAGVNSGGGRPQPRDDNGTINIMAALASMPYTPNESMAALKHFYRDLGPKAWGAFGFHDGFNATEDWYEEVYMALNQAPITVMIENYRTGLVWREFMANPEIKPALDAIGFRPDP